MCIISYLHKKTTPFGAVFYPYISYFLVGAKELLLNEIKLLGILNFKSGHIILFTSV